MIKARNIIATLVALDRPRHSRMKHPDRHADQPNLLFSFDYVFLPALGPIRLWEAV